MIMKHGICGIVIAVIASALPASEVHAGETTLALHDRTGFNGRCDAIPLTTKSGTSPNDPKTLPTLRNRLLGMPDRPASHGEGRQET